MSPQPVFRLVIEGRPATKKNHTRRIKRGRRIFTVQSEAHETWEAAAWPQLRDQWDRTYTTADHKRGIIGVGEPINRPVSMKALVYRDRDVGDLNNYLASICDVLQPKYLKTRTGKVCIWKGVVTNDKLVVAFDGSRLLIDRKRPRVEIELSEVTDGP